MKIDDALILKLERLAKLALNSDERTRIQNDLEAILDMVSKIDEVDTENVDPLIHLNEGFIGLREDAHSAEMKLEDVLRNAPQKKGIHFAVPKVISD